MALGSPSTPAPTMAVILWNAAWTCTADRTLTAERKQYGDRFASDSRRDRYGGCSGCSILYLLQQVWTATVKLLN